MIIASGLREPLGNEVFVAWQISGLATCLHAMIKLQAMAPNIDIILNDIKSRYTP